MTLLDSVVKTIGGPSPKQVPQANTDEERLTKQANLEQGQRDNLPAHPHSDEPQETEAEHAIERTMGHEVRPASRPRQSIPPMVRQSRPFPAKMMSCTVPKCTNAGRMLNKPAPRGMTGGTSKSMFGASPSMGTMRFDVPAMTAPKKSRLDPFKGLDGIGKKKKKTLPKGMQMFGKKGTGKRGIW